MKFTINCLLLFQAVKAASAAVRPNKSLPALNCLLFQADSTAGEVKVVGTNLQIQVKKSFVMLMLNVAALELYCRK